MNSTPSFASWRMPAAHICALALSFGCGLGQSEADVSSQSVAPTEPTSQASGSLSQGIALPNPAPELLANNALLYYADLDRAWAFYRDVLGFETVLDYGFAKMMRVAPTSYITLVDETKGMHSSDEPKTVALALLTDELPEWVTFLNSQSVEVVDAFSPGPGKAHDSHVILDPEGYYLEFERFLPHEENSKLLPALEPLTSVYTKSTIKRPSKLGVKATILWTYYDDIPEAKTFYQNLFSVEPILEQEFATVYQTSNSGFIGLVDGAKGFHKASRRQAVTLSFFTTQVDHWWDRARASSGFPLRSTEVGTESDAVRLFVGYDPAGYYIEFDTFLSNPQNARLNNLLAR